MVFIAAIALAECSCKNRYLFHPYKEIVATPASIGLSFEDVYFTTADAVRLNAWWVPAAGARATVLVCHGNGGNISYMLYTIRVFHDMKCNVLVFDYRGYGRSSGSPTEEGTYRDVDAAWRFLTETKKISPRSIVVIGHSLGGPIAAWLCQTRQPAALVLQSTFTRAAEVAIFHFRMAPGVVLFGDTYNTAAYVTRVRCPILVVHSPEDNIVPFDLGEKLYKACPDPKEFLLIHGDHNSAFIESLKQYVPALDRFITTSIQKYH